MYPSVLISERKEEEEEEQDIKKAYWEEKLRKSIEVTGRTKDRMSNLLICAVG